MTIVVVVLAWLLVGMLLNFVAVTVLRIRPQDWRIEMAAILIWPALFLIAIVRMVRQRLGAVGRLGLRTAGISGARDKDADDD